MAYQKALNYWNTLLNADAVVKIVDYESWVAEHLGSDFKAYREQQYHDKLAGLMKTYYEKPDFYKLSESMDAIKAADPIGFQLAYTFWSIVSFVFYDELVSTSSRSIAALYPYYDAQRQSMADYFNAPGAIVFQPFSNEELSALDQESPRMKAFAEHCLLVKPQHIDRIYNHILLSINWHVVLASQHSLEYGLTTKTNALLPLVQAWVKKQDCFETVLRRALVSLLRRQDLFVDEPDHHEWLNLTQLMDTLTRDSAKKYIALQYTDAGFDVNDYVPDEKNHFIRLTVHEKKDRADIPAIFTLGKLGGNYLSQNITVYLDKQGETRFKSLAEILGEYTVKAVYIDKACNQSLPLSWLNTEQPLCFVDHKSIEEKVPQTLKLAFKSWLEGMIDI